MCGLYFQISKVKKTDDYYEKKINQLKHRGPDNFNIKKIKIGEYNLIFCNSLLNTIGEYNDSVQPINTDEYLIICNGTIYNYKDISQATKESDIRILGDGLYNDGINFLEKCEGVFAFIFFNKKEKKIIVGRDFFGVRPLYITENSEDISISSEYKNLTEKILDIDYKALYNYFNLRYTTSDNTLFKKITKIKPYEFIIFELKSTGITKTVDYLNNKKENNINLNISLSNSIKNRSLTNSKISILQSGGIDSCYLAFKLKKEKIPFESYIINSNNINDINNAKKFCNELNIKLNIVDEKKYNFDELKKIIYHLDDPYGDPIILSLDSLASEIKKKSRVCLTGEGVDEIFGGYPHHKIFSILNIAFKYNLKFVIDFLLLNLPKNLIKKFISYSLDLDQKEINLLSSRIKKLKTLKDFNNITKFFDNISLNNNFYNNYKNFFAECDNEDIRISDLNEWLPNSQLFKMDKIFMKHSIEVREPYLSKNFVNEGIKNSILSNLSLTSDKIEFRKIALSDGFPVELMQKKKLSFTNSLNNQIELITEIKEKIRDNKSLLLNFFKEEFINEIILLKNQNVMNLKRIFIIGSFIAWVENNNKYLKI